MTPEEQAAADKAAAEQAAADKAAADAAAAAAKPNGRKVKARVLMTGAFGKIGQVVLVDKAIAKEHGELDADPAAVAFAEANLPTGD